MVLVARPATDADAFIVAVVVAEPPETFVPRSVVVPYSKKGVVDVPPVTIVPLNVAVVVPTAIGLLVVIETAATLASTFAAVHPPLGLNAGIFVSRLLFQIGGNGCI